VAGLGVSGIATQVRHSRRVPVSKALYAVKHNNDALIGSLWHPRSNTVLVVNPRANTTSVSFCVTKDDHDYVLRARTNALAMC